MGLRPAQHTGSVRVDCDRCGGHACPHVYRLRLGGVGCLADLCGSCVQQVAQVLLDSKPDYALSLADEWRRLREARDAMP